jgi:RHS repeat-associated protein
MEKSSQSFYYHVDGLGSITEVTNQSGTVAQRYTYSSFGKIESQLDQNFVQPYSYTSRERDFETGLYYYRVRVYDAGIGRFLQEDPIGTPGTSNLYRYVNGNPIAAIDPLGLDAIDNIANMSAGFGDTISLGITNWIRKKLNVNDVLDECSWSYSIGKWAGWAHSIALGGAGVLHGGAKTVVYSGDGALEAAQAVKGAGITLADTPLGGLLNAINNNVGKLPQSVWDVASAVFVANAKGNVTVVLRNANSTGTWARVESPVLDFVNKIHSLVGANATNLVPK